jgi:hypothetical protein
MKLLKNNADTSSQSASQLAKLGEAVSILTSESAVAREKKALLALKVVP